MPDEYPREEDSMARDADTIERDIEQARDALAVTLQEIGTRADPKRLVEAGKEQVEATMGNPTVRYSLMALGALIVLALLRKLFR
jgi:hypothetical protein